MVKNISIILQIKKLELCSERITLLNCFTLLIKIKLIFLNCINSKVSV